MDVLTCDPSFSCIVKGENGLCDGVNPICIKCETTDCGRTATVDSTIDDECQWTEVVGSCSKDCDGGIVEVSYKCLCGDGVTGIGCAGSKPGDTSRPCNTGIICSVNCQCPPFPSSWGPCIAPGDCGNGFQTKTRDCSEATGTGSTCASLGSEGASSISQPCDTGVQCPIDCNCPPFTGTFSSCIARDGGCGAGTQSRTRSCTESVGTGRRCTTADRVQTVACDTMIACTTPMSTEMCTCSPAVYGACNAICGTGLRTSTITCSGSGCSQDQRKIVTSVLCESPTACTSPVADTVNEDDGMEAGGIAAIAIVLLIVLVCNFDLVVYF